MGNLLCLASLLALLLGIAVWVRGHFVPADVEWFSRYTDTTHPPVTRTFCFGVGWGPGTFGVFHYHGQSPVPAETARTWLYREFNRTRTLNEGRAPTDRVNLRFGKFQFLHRIEPSLGGWLSLRIVVVPAWTTLALALPPLLFWRRRRRRSRARESLSY
jgi:hypothetical protein